MVSFYAEQNSSIHLLNSSKILYEQRSWKGMETNANLVSFYFSAFQLDIRQRWGNPRNLSFASPRANRRPPGGRAGSGAAAVGAGLAPRACGRGAVGGAPTPPLHRLPAALGSGTPGP